VTGGAFQTPLALWPSVPKVHGRFSPSSSGAGRSCFPAADSGVAAHLESGGNGTPLDYAELERCGVRSTQGESAKGNADWLLHGAVTFYRSALWVIAEPR
jgi:hypothetical protein